MTTPTPAIELNCVSDQPNLLLTRQFVTSATLTRRSASLTSPKNAMLSWPDIFEGQLHWLQLEAKPEDTENIILLIFFWQLIAYIWLLQRIRTAVATYVLWPLGPRSRILVFVWIHVYYPTFQRFACMARRKVLKVKESCQVFCPKNLLAPTHTKRLCWAWSKRNRFQCWIRREIPKEMSSWKTVNQTASTVKGPELSLNGDRYSFGSDTGERGRRSHHSWSRDADGRNRGSGTWPP